MPSDFNIIDYQPEFHEDFKRLNEEWIQKYFRLEDLDIRSLSSPQEYILDKGGAILVVLQNELVLGVCALIKMNGNPYDFELAKMAVSPAAHGQGIGYALGLAVIEKAKAMQARYLYLESNTKLVPAIRLYRKLGFKEVKGNTTPYERCNIQMVLEFH